MSKYPIKRIRTLALLGQAGAGKTTLAEALLARGAPIQAAGSEARGTSVFDKTHPEER